MAAPGLSVGAYAAQLDHPRRLFMLPNGDVLVPDDVGNTIRRLSPRPLDAPATARTAP
jgi:glucose/arabinose dehydrogenase